MPPPPVEIPIGAIVGGWTVLGPGEPDPHSNKARIRVQCRGCDGIAERTVYYLRKPTHGCRECEKRKRAAA